jgi:hypothetical protein
VLREVLDLEIDLQYQSWENYKNLEAIDLRLKDLLEIRNSKMAEGSRLIRAQHLVFFLRQSWEIALLLVKNEDWNTAIRLSDGSEPSLAKLRDFIEAAVANVPDLMTRINGRRQYRVEAKVLMDFLRKNKNILLLVEITQRIRGGQMICNKLPPPGDEKLTFLQEDLTDSNALIRAALKFYSLLCQKRPPKTKYVIISDTYRSEVDVPMTFATFPHLLTLDLMFPVLNTSEKGPLTILQVLEQTLEDYDKDFFGGHLYESESFRSAERSASTRSKDLIDFDDVKEWLNTNSQSLSATDCEDVLKIVSQSPALEESGRVFWSSLLDMAMKWIVKAFRNLEEVSADVCIALLEGVGNLDHLVGKKLQEFSKEGKPYDFRTEKDILEQFKASSSDLLQVAGDLIQGLRANTFVIRKKKEKTRDAKSYRQPNTSVKRRVRFQN